MDVMVCSKQVLDAPALQDDFYLNLVDWSAQNVLAVGLGNHHLLGSMHVGAYSLREQAFTAVTSSPSALLQPQMQLPQGGARQRKPCHV